MCTFDEYVDGEDLAALLQRIGRLPRDKGIDVGRKLCAGLAAAHAQGVLHRDLKPRNIMIDSHGGVRIMDFGIAVVADRLDPADIGFGTPAYMAPEQLAGREVTRQSDLYALGLVLFELFTGRRPFQAKSVDDLLRLREAFEITKPSLITEGLSETIDRAIIRCSNPTPRGGANRPSRWQQRCRAAEIRLPRRLLPGKPRHRPPSLLQEQRRHCARRVGSRC